MTSVGAPYYAVADRLVIGFLTCIGIICLAWLVGILIRQIRKDACARKLRKQARAFDHAAISLEHFNEVVKLFERR